MSQIFSNRNTGSPLVPASGSCGGYTPASGDSRRLRVTITPQSTGVAATLPQDLIIRSIPQAEVADTLQGLTPTQLLQISGNATP